MLGSALPQSLQEAVLYGTEKDDSQLGLLMQNYYKKPYHMTTPLLTA